MSAETHGRFVVLWSLLLGCLLVSAAHGERLVVHLPSHGAESAGRLAAGLDQLTTQLDRSLAGLKLESEIFRRQADMDSFLRAQSEVALVLSDASLLIEPPIGLTPLARFVMGGGTEYHRVVVVPAQSSVQRLADLQGQELTVVQTTSGLDYLGPSVFAGELDPASYFSSLRQVVDDGEAVTDVLFGQAPAALVAEHAPLLVANLGTKLRVVYRSGTLSLPIISTRTGALDDEQRRAVLSTLDQLSRGGQGGSLLADLGIEGFRIVAEGSAEQVHATGSARTMSLDTDVAMEAWDPVLPAPAELPLPRIVVISEPTPVAESLVGEENKEP